MPITIDINSRTRYKLATYMTKRYIAYYGNAPLITVSNKPKLVVLDNKPKYRPNAVDMDSYIEWLSKEGIDSNNIIKHDPKVPY